MFGGSMSRTAHLSTNQKRVIHFWYRTTSSWSIVPPLSSNYIISLPPPPHVCVVGFSISQPYPYSLLYPVLPFPDPFNPHSCISPLLFYKISYVCFFEILLLFHGYFTSYLISMTILNEAHMSQV